jgi:hypothetical protein
MRFTHEQLHTCLDIIRSNDADGTSFNNSAMCVGYLIEEGLDQPAATELYAAAEVIDEMGLA